MLFFGRRRGVLRHDAHQFVGHIRLLQPGAFRFCQGQVHRLGGALNVTRLGVSGEDQDIVTLYFGNAPKGAVLVKKVSSADNSPLSDVEFL